MKYYDFKYWIIGVSNNSDVMDAINAYMCLIGDTNRVPDLLDEEIGRRLAIKEGYTIDELTEIEADPEGLKVALIKEEI